MVYRNIYVDFHSIPLMKEFFLQFCCAQRYLYKKKRKLFFEEKDIDTYRYLCTIKNLNKQCFDSDLQ